jgi:hypothetical protein
MQNLPYQTYHAKPTMPKLPYQTYHAKLPFAELLDEPQALPVDLL